MNGLYFEIFVIFLLVVANGVFAMAEIALISVKKSRLIQLSNQGNHSAQLKFYRTIKRWVDLS